MVKYNVYSNPTTFGELFVGATYLLAPEGKPDIVIHYLEEKVSDSEARYKYNGSRIGNYTVSNDTVVYRVKIDGDDMFLLNGPTEVTVEVCDG